MQSIPWPQRLAVGKMADDPGPDLAEAFAQIARSLIAETNLQASLQRIVSLAVETIGTCDYAGTSGIEERSGDIARLERCSTGARRQDSI